MEREVLQLQEELKEKEIALQERTELIEHLERKLQVLSHARSAEIRKLKRESSVNKGSTVKTLLLLCSPCPLQLSFTSFPTFTLLSSPPSLSQRLPFGGLTD